MGSWLRDGARGTFSRRRPCAQGLSPGAAAWVLFVPGAAAHWRAVVLQLLAASWLSGILKSLLVGFVSVKRQFAVSVTSAYLKLHNTSQLLTSME